MHEIFFSIVLLKCIAYKNLIKGNNICILIMIIHQVEFQTIFESLMLEYLIFDRLLKLKKYFSLAAACWFFLLNLVWLLSSTFRYSVEENGEFDDS